MNARTKPQLTFYVNLKVLLRNSFILLSSLICVYSPLSAQNSKALAFSSLTINDGLSQGLVMRIFQDHFGFMWFATLDGLNRYDGYKFVVFRHDAHNPASITESYVQSFFEDSKGRLWIATKSGGLDLFDRKTETFIHVKYSVSHQRNQLQGEVSSFAEDQHGQVWVQVHDQLYKIGVNSRENSTVNDFTLQPAAAPFHSASAYLFGTKDRLVYYVNAGDGIVYKLNDGKKETWSTAYKLESTATKKQKPDGRFRIIQLLEDTTQNRLFVFHENGVNTVDKNSFLLKEQFKVEGFDGHSKTLNAYLDKDGLAWFIYKGDMVVFDTRSGKLNSTVAADSSFSWVAKNSYSTFIDRSGLLWVGTNGYGVLKRNKRAESFHHTGKTSLYTIHEAANGQILFGSNFAQAKIFDRATKKLIDGPGTIKTKSGQDFYKSVFNAPILINEWGRWVVDGNNLSCITGKEKMNFRLPLPNNADYPDFIQTTLGDKKGNIWLGTTEGLLRFRLVDKSWKIYQSQSNDPSSLSSKRIFSLCFDPAQPEKYLWVGTDGGGLNRMDLQTGKCMVYRVKNGLPNDVIYGILQDDAGNLWMSTNKGLSCFNPPTQTFRNFDYKDGLQSNEFNRRSYLRTKDGCLFFGGVNGFNYFYPWKIDHNQTVPPVVITSLKIRNEPLEITAGNTPLQAAPYLVNGLTLPYDKNFISFEFSALDFTNPQRNQYQYKLEGLDKNWIASGNFNSATYTNLDPGTYTFKVKGSSNDGIWNEQGASLQLVILPPWYMTWWFRVAVLMAVLLVGYAFYRYRLRQALRLQTIRDRIAGDLHDEVGSNLSNIYIFSNVAHQKALAKNEATAPLLQKINDYTQQSMEAMNDIVWMINTGNDHFENVIIKMRTLAAEFAETSNCSLQLHFDESLNTLKLKMEDRKNLYLIFKEALNNTAKYAECMCLQIHMKQEGAWITLTISDDGKGFDTTHFKKGNGLSNMKKRAALLNGTFTVTSSVGKGTTLTLRFKI